MNDPREELALRISDLIDYADSIGARVSVDVRNKVEAIKKVSSIVGDYEVELTSAVVAYFNGDASISRVRRAFTTSPREYARDTYVEGMSEGGLDESELDEEDELAIDAWIDVQIDHVEGFVEFAKTIKSVPDEARSARQSAILDRVKLWVKELRDLGGKGRLRAKDGELAFWELGDTEDHCDSCLSNSRLKPHRVKWWRDADRLPRSKDLDCKGFNCDCRLKSAKTGRTLYP